MLYVAHSNRPKRFNSSLMILSRLPMVFGGLSKASRQSTSLAAIEIARNDKLSQDERNKQAIALAPLRRKPR